VTTAILELTQEQIDANRRKVIRALKRSKHQCFGTLFEDRAVCAVGCAARALLGIQNESQAEAYGQSRIYGEIERLLGYIDVGGNSLRWLWRLNDGHRALTLPEIGAECERRWFPGDAS